MKTRSRSSARIAAHKLLSSATQDCSASADGRTRSSLRTYFILSCLRKIPPRDGEGFSSLEARGLIVHYA